MMATLPQTPAQTNLAAIFAALGSATPASASETGRFEQLIAGMPVTATAPAMPVVDACAMRIDAAPALPADTATALPARNTTTAALPANNAPAPAAARHAKTAPAADAVDAASLLVAAVTPGVEAPAETPARDTMIPVAANDTDAEADTDTPADSAPAIAVAGDSADIPVPIAALPIALPAATPVTDKSASDKSAKPALVAARDSEAPVTPAKARDAAPSLPLPAFAAAAETKAAKPVAEAGASMAVLFTQGAPHGTVVTGDTAKAAPVTERVLDTNSDDQWIAQLAADIAATKSDKGDISFRLMPRNLGRLDVSMLTGDDGVSLKLDTQHEATATIVHAAQPRLVEDLRQQGVRVAGAEVTCTPDQAGRQQQGQSRSAAPDTTHLIETATERAAPRHEERAADRRGRFA